MLSNLGTCFHVKMLSSNIFKWLPKIRPLFCVLTLLTLSSGEVDIKKNLYALDIEALDDLAVADFLVVTDLLKLQQGRVRDPAKNDSDPTVFEVAADRYLKDFEGGTGLNLSDSSVIEGLKTTDWISSRASKVGENAISAYRLIRRFKVGIPRLLENAPKDFVFSTNWVETKERWPNQSDVSDALMGILDLHFHYDLDVGEMADGILAGRQTGPKLQAVHCFELGVAAYKSKNFALSVEWLELALEKVIWLNDSSANQTKIEKALEKSKTKHDIEGISTLIEPNPYFFEELLEDEKVSNWTDKNCRNTTENPADCRRPRRKRHPIYDAVLWNGRRSKRNTWDYYNGICRGKNYQTEEEKSRLFCWLERQTDPFFYIGPLKIEFLSRNPDVVQIYEFAPDQLVETMVNYSRGHYRQASQLGSSKKGQSFVTGKGRMAMSYAATRWAPYIPSLKNKIEMVTHLEVKNLAAEPFQFVTYTFAGHYVPHLDSAEEEMHKGALMYRIATFMIYLSNVEEKGQTAFPLVGTHANPVKGSAVFWYNLLQNGAPDLEMWHGACPPLLGRKLAVTEWILMYGQPCPLKRPKAKFRFKVNGKIPE